MGKVKLIFGVMTLAFLMTATAWAKVPFDGRRGFCPLSECPEAQAPGGAATVSAATAQSSPDQIVPAPVPPTPPATTPAGASKPKFVRTTQKGDVTGYVLAGVIFPASDSLKISPLGNIGMRVDAGHFDVGLEYGYALLDIEDFNDNLAMHRVALTVGNLFSEKSQYRWDVGGLYVHGRDDTGNENAFGGWAAVSFEPWKNVVFRLSADAAEKSERQYGGVALSLGYVF